MKAASVNRQSNTSENEKLTYLACILGISNQAVITMVSALLFVPFMQLYGFELYMLGITVGVNFAAQIAADFIVSLLIDKVSYRKIAYVALSMSFCGLVLFGLLPFFVPVAYMFAAMLGATVIFAFSSGMLEIIITPIADGITTATSKNKAINGIHAFYAWGQLIFVLLTTLYLYIFGIQYWQYIVLFWSLLPICCFVCFAVCPIHQRKNTEEKVKRTMFSPYMLLSIAAIMTGGATEVIINQYISAFGELALGFSKVSADFLGTCLFAASMAVSRSFFAALGDKINLNKLLTACALLSGFLYIAAGTVPSAAVGLACCVFLGFTTSLLWPGTLVIAGKRFSGSGAWIFAVLSLSGDIGAGVLPAVTGFVAGAVGLKFTFIIMSVVPFACFVAHLAMAIDGKNKISRL